MVGSMCDGNFKFRRWDLVQLQHYICVGEEKVGLMGWVSANWEELEARPGLDPCWKRGEGWYGVMLSGVEWVIPEEAMVLVLRDGKEVKYE